MSMESDFNSGQTFHGYDKNGQPEHSSGAVGWWNDFFENEYSVAVRTTNTFTPLPENELDAITCSSLARLNVLLSGALQSDEMIPIIHNSRISLPASVTVRINQIRVVDSIHQLLEKDFLLFGSDIEFLVTKQEERSLQRQIEFKRPKRVDRSLESQVFLGSAYHLLDDFLDENEKSSFLVVLEAFDELNKAIASDVQHVDLLPARRQAEAQLLIFLRGLNSSNIARVLLVAKWLKCYISYLTNFIEYQDQKLTTRSYFTHELGFVSEPEFPVISNSFDTSKIPEQSRERFWYQNYMRSAIESFLLKFDLSLREI